MPEDRIVFIVGSPRSGTTWLHNMMSDHPQVVPLTARDFGFPDLVHEEAGVDQPVNETGAFLNYSPQHIKAVIERMRKAHPGKWLVEKTPTHALLSTRSGVSWRMLVLWYLRRCRARHSSALAGTMCE